MTRNTTSTRPTWSWDGKGINGPDEYRRRLFTAWDADDREDSAEIDKAGILAAAAPDMLAALESALKTAEFERAPLRPWHDEARAAIAKATGE